MLPIFLASEWPMHMKSAEFDEISVLALQAVAAGRSANLFAKRDVLCGGGICFEGIPFALTTSRTGNLVSTRHLESQQTDHFTPSNTPSA